MIFFRWYRGCFLANLVSLWGTVMVAGGIAALFEQETEEMAVGAVVIAIGILLKIGANALAKNKRKKMQQKQMKQAGRR